MADYYVDILEPKQNPEESIRLLAEVITPLYHTYWEKTQQEKYDGRPFDLQAQIFTSLWFTGASKIFIAYNRPDDKPIGFLLGMLFRPMLYNGHVFQIEDWYADDPDVVKGLFDFSLRALRFLGCDELRVERPFPQEVVGGEWKETGVFERVRFTKAE